MSGCCWPCCESNRRDRASFSARRDAIDSHLQPRRHAGRCAVATSSSFASLRQLPHRASDSSSLIQQFVLLKKLVMMFELMSSRVMIGLWLRNTKNAAYNTITCHTHHIHRQMCADVGATAAKGAAANGIRERRPLKVYPSANSSNTTDSGAARTAAELFP